MTSEVGRGWVILDGNVYKIHDLLESDCYEVGTRFVSMSLIEMEEVNGLDESSSGVY